jgi:hypothetical protein
MNSEQLYLASLKMLNDKYLITNYPKDKFISIFNDTYKDNNLNPLNPNNDINKLILIKIKSDIESEKSNINNLNNDNDKNDIIIENKLKELENIRSSMNLLSTTFDSSINTENDFNKNDNVIPNIQITNQNPIINNNFKTFIINTNKNNFKVNTTIDIKSNLIYPCCICLPFNIKKITPYILLSINDGVKTSNYTFILNYINNSYWDIWKPITDNYININLNNNNWIISFIDFRGNLIDLSQYYYTINDILEDNNTYSISIDDFKKFEINDKIKIIKENGSIIDNVILNITNNNRIIIKKNNLNINDFINSMIYNYNTQISILFKYQPKI